MKITNDWTMDQRVAVARACALLNRQFCMRTGRNPGPGEAPNAESIFVVLTAVASPDDEAIAKLQDIIDDAESKGLSAKAKAQIEAAGGPNQWIA